MKRLSIMRPSKDSNRSDDPNDRTPPIAMSEPPAIEPRAQAPHAARTPTEAELLSTLFDLGREVMSVLDLDELLAKIPQLIARLTRFSAFSVYLLDEQRQELRI